ncbi:MAG: hypothetical protein IJC07_02950 [Clostridia bacterium]|nr:hypothetical protein [Clostridia bacterium]
MNIDPTGTSLTAIIVLAIIGVAAGLFVAGVVDHCDDGELFNGSVKWYNYLGAAVLGGLIGAAVGYAYPYISSAIGSAHSGAGAGSTLALAGGGTTSTAVSSKVLEALVGLGILFAKNSRSSDKDRSTDKPSWVNRGMLDEGKSAKQNAKRLLDIKWGPGNWGKGPGSEYSKIIKWLIRCLGFK